MTVSNSRRRPGNPAFAVAVDAAGVVADDAVDLDLPAFGDFRRVALEFRVKVDAAVAVGFALEAQRQIKVLIVFLGGEVTVFLGHALAVDGAVFHDPFFVADVAPAREVLAVE